MLFIDKLVFKNEKLCYEKNIMKIYVSLIY
jgi:hypothetical protein